MSKKWWKAAGIRALKTAAEVALGMFSFGMAINEVDWVHVASVAALAAIYSLLINIKGLPELKEEEDE